MADRVDVFFDLDHTLWDFESNSRDALEQLYYGHTLHAAGILSLNAFMERYRAINEECWMLYREGHMQREELRIERFRRVLKSFDVEHARLASRLADAYVDISPSKTKLMPGSIEVLEYLRSQGYRMHILTNGFREVQYRKLDGSGLSAYFETVHTSEELGYTKPRYEAFVGAMTRANAKAETSWMIGDSLEADIIGAKNAGMTTVLYHPHVEPEPEVPHFSVRSHHELLRIL